MLCYVDLWGLDPSMMMLSRWAWGKVSKSPNAMNWRQGYALVIKLLSLYPDMYSKHQDGSVAMCLLTYVFMAMHD